MNSNTEWNPLKAIQKIKEQNQSLQNGKTLSEKKKGEATSVKNVKTEKKGLHTKENLSKVKAKSVKYKTEFFTSKKTKNIVKPEIKPEIKPPIPKGKNLGRELRLASPMDIRQRVEKQELSVTTQKVPSKVIKKAQKGKKLSPVKVIPLGGLEQIGMNITVFEYDDTIIVVDCGLAFPSDDMLGIDLVIPDITYLKNNAHKVKAYVITHGHEDHIGALPYILKQLNAPVYSTRLTIALIERKLKEHNIDKITDLNIVQYGDVLSLGDFRVEYIRTNHSIADAAALAIFTPVGTIFHTGDFKIDYTPVFGEAADLQRMAEIGKEGCMLMICESTNATKPGFTMSERSVGKTFDTVFSEHPHQRILVATFASNVDRVQQVINSAHKFGRKVVVEGRSMVNVIGVASELGYLRIPEGTLIDIDNLKNYPPEKTVIITTGSQGESMAALSRMASSIHKKVTISSEDIIIMSSTPIPGNEKAVAKVLNELTMKGADIIMQDMHVSGHACQEEIKLMYNLLKPKYALPIHGEYRHRRANKSLAESMGMERDNIAMISSGDVLEVSEDFFKVTSRVEAGTTFVDGLGVGDVGNIVLRDRQNLSQNGIIIIAITLEKGSNRVLSGPDIVSRGFVYVRESTELMEEAKKVVENALFDCIDSHVTDWSKLKNIVRDALSDFLWKRMKRNPVILPIIMEV